MAAVGVKGLREAVKGLQGLGADLADLKEGMAAAGEIVADKARADAPVKTGAYKASIRTAKTKNKVAIRAGSKKVPYAGALESKQHPLWNAAVAEGPEATRAVERTLATLLARTTGQS
jgi:hypothetical protein